LASFFVFIPFKVQETIPLIAIEKHLKKCYIGLRILALFPELERGYI